jgi:hypothetical protein
VQGDTVIRPELPKFRDPSNAFLATPPFSFQGMTVRMFPLRANIETLQDLVNHRLNLGPPEVAHFRASAPYAYLMMMDYGELALEATNLGWLSQKEILFAVPLEWYKVENGRWVFHDFAMFTPYIFVTDEISMTLGRTVYGWPKAIATLSKSTFDWMTNPAASIQQASIKTKVFPLLYKGLKLQSKVFLDVECLPAITTFDVPFESRIPVAPWTWASNVAAAWTGFARDTVGLLRGFDLLPMDERTTPDNYIAMMARGVQSASPFKPNLAVNTINLKQFRRSDWPERYAYQALTNGPMKLTSLNRFGISGEERILLGDVSGGYSIKLYEFPSLPIIDKLGLEVFRRWTGEDTTVAELKPVLPFWYDVNMDYGAGHNLAYRGDDGIWHEESTGRAFPPRESAGRAPKVREEDLQFNTTLGDPVDSVAGPFTFIDVTCRVLPLLANAETLQCYLDGYLNEQLELFRRKDGSTDRFELWKAKNSPYAYVYAAIIDLGDVTSLDNNVGDWGNIELTFVVPVKRYRHGELVGVGLVPVFSYVDTTIAAIGRTEVLGIPTTQAEFPEPENLWLTSGGPTDKQKLLKMKVEVLPAVGEGQKTETREIFVLRHGVPGDEVQRPDRAAKADAWCAQLLEELARKLEVEANPPNEDLQNLLALSLEILINGMPVNLYTLKQFRDCTDPDRACYQSLLRIPLTILELYSVREIEEPLVVRMHEFPTQKVVSQLGLVGQNVTGPGMGISWELQPIRPFLIRAMVREGLGERILSLAGSHCMHTDVDKDDGRRDCEPVSRHPSLGDDLREYDVGPALVEEIDGGDPRQLARATRSFAAAKGPQKVTTAEARTAVEAIDPQVVIEALLSREWGNNTSPRWHQGLVEIKEWHRKALQGLSPGQRVSREQAFFIRRLNACPDRFRSIPNRAGIFGDPAPRRTLGDLAKEMIGTLAVLTTKRDTMLTQWDAVSNLGVWAPPLQADPDTIAQGVLNFLQSILDAAAVSVVDAGPAASSRTKTHSVGQVAANAERFEGIRKKHPVTVLLESESNVWKANDLRNEPGGALATVLEARDFIVELAELVDKRPDLQRELLFTLLAGAWKKPDFVVRRDAAGDEADEIFPMAESWDPTWFQGTDAGHLLTYSEPEP